MCAELRKDLRRELRRRNLSEASPRLVGIADNSWNDDALAELASDAYAHSFIRRQRGLQNARRARKDIGGLMKGCWHRLPTALRSASASWFSLTAPFTTSPSRR